MIEELSLRPDNLTKSNAWATWSLVLGIIAIPLFVLIIPEILAIIFGIIALVNISKSKDKLKGKGPAIAGIILGGFAFILLMISIIAAIAIPNLLSSKENADKKRNALKTSEVVSNNGVCQVSIPGDWKVENDLNEGADIQVGNSNKGEYLIVITDSKLDFDNITIEKHSELTRDHLMGNAKNCEVVGPAKNLVINGQPAVEYEIRGVVDNMNIVYLHVTVEGKDHFHQVVAWSIASRFTKNKEVLESVINSFKEVR